MKNQGLKKGLIFSAIAILVVGLIVGGYIALMQSTIRGEARKHWEYANTRSAVYQDQDVEIIKTNYSPTIIDDGISLLTDYIVLRTSNDLTFKFACTPHFDMGMVCEYVAEDGFSDNDFGAFLAHINQDKIASLITKYNGTYDPQYKDTPHVIFKSASDRRAFSSEVIALPHIKNLYNYCNSNEYLSCFSFTPLYVKDNSLSEYYNVYYSAYH